MSLDETLLPKVQKNVPGIIGGTGTLAAIEFETKLLELGTVRGACSDQEHILWILINATAIPDRTKSLIGEVEDCTNYYVQYSRILQKAGADFIVTTCNTAHAFHDTVQKYISIPWINLIEITVNYIQTQFPETKKIGLLATNGTLESKLYENMLSNIGFQCIYPTINSDIQKLVMDSIYDKEFGVKATGKAVSQNATKGFKKAARWLHAQGAELLIAGCTEISVGLKYSDKLDFIWIDPLDVLAKVTHNLAYSDWLYQNSSGSH